ncbi:hypothetical protein [Corynebacterium auris]|uniref:hypothetical protein n=1 Tax=Corynebacterium auris TaxID=44750 RepID=UPI0025B30B83|nr:hypothetical protein [Corynebacterium auris]WJY69094.1 hypothetical protein CAURIS_11130 [Corynebacterium auris]
MNSVSKPAGFKTANDARRELYKAQGAKFLLREDYQCDRQPEWRLVHFAIILPVPALPDGFTWPERWVPGRFRGIKTVEYAKKGADGRFRRARRGNGPDFDYSPRVFHKSAGTYFRGPLASSLGADALDARVKEDEEPQERPEQRESSPATVIARRYMFEADLTEEQEHIPPQVDTEPFHWDLEYDEDHPHSSMRLISAEVLTYTGPDLYNLKNDERFPFSTTFLVLHVVAEHCSGKQLESINYSLTRPRNKINKRAKDSLLEGAVKIVNKRLFPNEKTNPWRVTKGGYIDFSHTLYNSRQPAKPYCITVAVPGGEELPEPEPIKGKQHDEDTWPVHDKWAWFLASRFDQYTTDIPAFTEASLAASITTRYRDWTVHSSDEGLAFVRRGPLENSQNMFIMLAGTRFVDLVILTLRARTYLDRIAAQLRQLSFSEVLRVLDKGDPTNLSDTDHKLQHSLATFSKVQMEFVYLRDHLWYERVPRREVATTILRDILVKTGARSDFDDISNELELRKDVYTTQYNFARIRLDRIRAEELERAQEIREKRNMTLAFAAVVLALPGLFALLPPAGTMTLFWTCLALILVLVGAVFWYQRRNREKRSEN